MSSLYSTSLQKQMQNTENLNKTDMIERYFPSLTPGKLYLRKMRKGSKILKGLTMIEVPFGKRIAIINAIGNICIYTYT